MAEVEAEKRAHAITWLAEAAEGRGDVRIIDPAAIFCDERFCRGSDPGEVYYSDTNHITDAGVRAITAAFEADFDWAMNSP